MRRTRSDCCARAATGHAAAPPSSVMNFAASHALPQAEEPTLPHRLMAELCITAQLHR